MYSAIIRNAEALGGKNVSHDAVKKISFQSLKVAKVISSRVFNQPQVRPDLLWKLHVLRIAYAIYTESYNLGYMISILTE